ncbi:putative POL2-DNA polymerase epsilon, calytic subunit A [Phlyctochytrium arcticum]|nr:putative POL2-DNA polymerase epsilon, calytic subunit A [Phlyctochytrium arcticum]
MTFGGGFGGGRSRGRGAFKGKYRGGKRDRRNWSSYRANSAHYANGSTAENAEAEQGASAADIVEDLHAQNQEHAEPRSIPWGEDTADTLDSLEESKAEVRTRDEMDEKMGFFRYSEGPERLGWMVNMHPTTLFDGEWPSGKSAVDLYFLDESGGSFKSTVVYEPYFCVMCKPGTEAEVEEYIRRRFDKVILSVERLVKEDLSLPNHLLGHQRAVLKLRFWNMQNLLAVRKVLLPAALRNKAKKETTGAYEEVAEMTNPQTSIDQPQQKSNRETLDCIVDLREYDVIYYTRAAIDCDLRVGLWYSVKAVQSSIVLVPRPDIVKRADPVVLAYDIETTKLPLKFPDAAIDSIMMISYMIDGMGYLITNREIVSEDIDDFVYTSKPEYPGSFQIFNEPDEESLIRRFFEHITKSRPSIIVTYNGDFFDWPFVDARARENGIDMTAEIGFYKDSSDEYKSFYAGHMDAFCWVKRDSYLPQGSQGLKAVTTAKLGYNPMELDPEDMTRFAAEQPQVLAQYSVSDAVATYYLYMKYVHPFVFSLCNIIPMNPDDVLRRGSGTLCEALLMVEAYKAGIIMPNKHTDKVGQFFEGHLLESETYVGGHVEALEAGVFRSDLPVKFRLVPEAFQQLIDEIDAALKFSIVVEGKLKLEDVTNYDEVRSAIIQNLEELRDVPNRLEKPSIYHLDVAAMYPNIILTNRLQPDAIVSEEACAACDFNQGPGSSCQRNMEWSWRGEYFPAKKSEYNMIRNQIQQEKFPGRFPNDPARAFHDLRPGEQFAQIKKRMSTYSRKVYNKIHETKVVSKESVVCQRENPFYVDTVRAFRDRRYEYKGLLKTWKKKLDEATAAGDLTKVDEAKRLIVVYDSLQLAHKCILNSFYGYVMRKGARWYSMEMAGIVCLTGARIIQLARTRIDQIGRPLELDTDGIWCMFPATFPENFAFKLANGKMFPISYPCVMLNHLVHDQFTNHQYQQLSDPEKKLYATQSENSIFFEVDGPYRAMILPSSTEEDKLLKKRYAVFNDDGSLAELKGFEVKRRGELKLIKIFQSQLFKVFLDGTTLEECYTSVANVTNQWLDILYTKGAGVGDAELFDLISENRSMSKSLEEYGAQKSTSISTAKRLAEFLGDQMVKDKGLNCRFIISARPYGLPVSDRAIPVVIFHTESGVKKHYLRKWLRDSSLQTFDIRDILDWKYYLERFGSVIQKLITIPAAMQGVKNPVPRVRHPDWMQKRLAAKDDKTKQFRITELFPKASALPPVDTEDNGDSEGVENVDPISTERAILDVEDFGRSAASKSVLSNGRIVPVVHKITKVLGKRKGRNNNNSNVMDIPEEDPNEPAPDMHEDYPSWVAYQKRKWKRQRAQRQAETAMFGSRSRPSNQLRGGVGKFLRQQARNILASSWQVLHIAETESPGEFRVWALIHDDLQAITISVPRTFFVNSRISDPDEHTEKAGMTMTRRVRTLPRCHPCLFLYEMRMSEAFYRDNLGLFSAMSDHQEIEGVYELQVPLLFRALIKMGCIAQVDKNRVLSGRGLDQGFELDEINHTSIDNQTPYLPPTVKLNYLFLFRTSHNNRQIIGLFSTTLKAGWVFIVDGARNRDAVPNVSRLYSEMAQEYHDATTPSQNSQDDSRLFEYPSELDISVTLHKTEMDAVTAVNKQLKTYQEQRRGPTILAVQSSKGLQELQIDGLSLLSDFPTFTVPVNKKDTAFPALGWQQYACKRLISHYFELKDLLAEKMALARYADVPFCNIGHDYTSFLADLGFARRLKRADMVLWYSNSDMPDLGGHEHDDYRVELDELINPEINNPGCYEKVCIELSVWDLTINTFMQSGLMTEVEGGGSGLGAVATSVQRIGHFMDDFTKTEGEEVSDDHIRGGSSNGETLSPLTFSILKSMVMGWADDVRKQNRLASCMLEHLYRWITSPASRFFDPVIHSLIHDLMRRVFMEMMAEFKRLGSTVVYATFDKVVLATSKNDFPSAIVYGPYITDAFAKKSLFETMEFKIERYWGYLLWMDPHNFGGVVCENVNDLLEEADRNRKIQRAVNSAPLPVEDEDAQPKVLPVLMADMEWNIGEYLPPAVQQRFLKTLAEYIYKVLKYKEQYIATGQSSGVRDSETHNFTLFCRELINTSVKRQLLKMIPEIIRHVQSESDPQAYEFPVLPGSYLTMTNTALEFVKFTCAVLALDTWNQREVRNLKQNLLRLIDIKEFESNTAFINPCEPFKLPQVICGFCNHCRDLDLTRDKDLVPRRMDESLPDDHGDTAVTSYQTTQGSFSCPGCDSEYDRAAIEQRMLDVCQKRLAAWQHQNIRCPRCKHTKAQDLKDECERCNGKVELEFSRDDFVKRMKVFGSIAKCNQFHILADVVKWVMTLI